MRKLAIQVMIICFLLGVCCTYLFMKYYHTEDENRYKAINWYYDDDLLKKANSSAYIILTKEEYNFLAARVFNEKNEVSLDWKLRITAELAK